MCTPHALGPKDRIGVSWAAAFQVLNHVCASQTTPQDDTLEAAISWPDARACPLCR